VRDEHLIVAAVRAARARREQPCALSRGAALRSVPGLASFVLVDPWI